MKLPSNKRIIVRFNRQNWEKIGKIVLFCGEKYQSRSHFVRCACIKLVREEEKQLKVLKSIKKTSSERAEKSASGVEM
jgi:Arc/MetJ-type ribon-helix-helix transcriptional regulator